MLSTDDIARPELSIILNALPTLGLSNGLMLHGLSDGVFIILLHLLPKLQVLDIEAMSDLSHIACSCFGPIGGIVPIALQSISELSLYGSLSPRCSGGLRVEDFAPFMALPSLRTIKVYDVCEVDPDRPRWLQLDVPMLDTSIPSFPAFLRVPGGYGLLANSSSIRSLCLTSCAVPSQTLSRVVKLPKRLEIFKYEIMDTNSEPFSPLHLVPGLSSQLSSLRELEITIDRCNDHWDGSVIGSLSGMIALKKLSIPLRFLFAGELEEDPLDEDEIFVAEKRRKDKGILLHRPYSRNPLDDLLPPNLVTLKLDIESLPLAEFIDQTGIPRSLFHTRQRIPSLLALIVNGSNHWAPMVHQVIERAPKLDPPFKLTLFTYTQVQPTTFTSVYVSTSVIDNTKTMEVTMTELMTSTATQIMTSTATMTDTTTATATQTTTVQNTSLATCLQSCAMQWPMWGTGSYTMATSTTAPSYGMTTSTTSSMAYQTSAPACGSGGC
ncbi:hypothetical protein DL93DRAFT_2228003 [Clavulina sp. PMI_390]|nr:hypothetical protein DL93DRAFT_2228003 [Clavulina sp. PMI_390]